MVLLGATLVSRKLRRAARSHLSLRSGTAGCSTGPLHPVRTGLRQLPNSGILQVPAEWRRWNHSPTQGSREVPAVNWQVEQCPLLAYHSIAELYPEAPELEGLFDSDARFRQQLRQAVRRDLQSDAARIDEGLLNHSDARLGSSCQAFLGDFVGRDRLRLKELPFLTEVFLSYKIGLSGRDFMARLLGLCAGVAAGSWTEIVCGGVLQRGQGWHQDEGLDTYTVMLGFPPTNHFAGKGVFSNVAKLSHRLAPVGPSIPIEPDLEVPEGTVLRPVYARGQEIFVYNDSALLHCAPDKPNRECLWRLM